MHTRLATLAAIILMTGPVQPTGAVDLATEAMVTIVEGIELQQNSALDFGILARNDGTVTVSAVDGSYTDPGAIVYDNTSITQGAFTVESVPGATVGLACAPGAMPAGLDLHTFTVQWAASGSEDPVPASHVLTSPVEAMTLGASLTVDATAMPVPLGAVQLPYTIAVTFQ